MYDPYAEFTKHILPNGLEVHHVFWDRPWVVVEIVVHSGSREDPVEMPGLAHFVEHVVSKNIPNRELDQSRRFFKTCGGQFGLGRTSYLSTKYDFRVPSDIATFSEALEIVGSMLFEARIKNDVDQQRKIINREFSVEYPILQRLGWEMGTRKVLFRGHRLETWVGTLGRPESFLSTTEADLQGFYDKHYVPANISLVFVGGLSAKDIITLLENSPFGMQKSGTRNQIPKPFNQIPIVEDRSRTIKLSDYFNFKVDVAGYNASWTFPIDFPRQTFRVFDQMFREITFNEIREKRGMTYDMSFDYVDFQDIREYSVGVKVSSSDMPRIHELIRDCISMIPLRPDLFDEVVKSTTQQCLMVDVSGSDLASNCSHRLSLDHKIITTQDMWNELHKVRFDQMAEAAALLSSLRQYTFITCP